MPITTKANFLNIPMFINRDTYKGRGRPKKSDYMTMYQHVMKLNAERLVSGEEKM